MTVGQQIAIEYSDERIPDLSTMSDKQRQEYELLYRQMTNYCRLNHIPGNLLRVSDYGKGNYLVVVERKDLSINDMRDCVVAANDDSIRSPVHSEGLLKFVVDKWSLQ